MKREARWMGVVLAGAALSGCGALLGLDQFTEGSGTTGTSTSTGGATSSSTSSATSGSACMGAETQSCYDFDAATLGKGVCKGGTKTCKNGVFGVCEGQVGPSTEDCSKADDEDCDGVACSEAIWSEEFGSIGGGNKNFAVVEDLAVDADGSVLTAGVFAGTTNFGSGPSTALTAADGDFDIFLTRFAPDGSHLSSKGFEVAGDGTQIVRIAVSSTGQVFLSAFYKVSIDFGTKKLIAGGMSQRDFFVASFDKDANLLWAKTFGLDSVSFINDIAVGPDGDLAVVGQYSTGAIAFDNITYPTPSGFDAFVAKLNHKDGSVAWSLSFGDDASFPAGDQAATAVAVDSNNNVSVAGTMNAEIRYDALDEDHVPTGENHVFVAQLLPDGKLNWHTSFSGTKIESATSLDVDSTGGVFVAGAFAGAAKFTSTDGFSNAKSTSGPMDDDFYLVKLTAQGNHAWVKQYGDTSSQTGLNDLGLPPFLVHVDSKDNVLLAGGFFGSMALGDTPIKSAGDADWFVGKIGSDGTHIWSKSFGDSSPVQYVTGVGSDPKTNAVVLGGTNDGTLAIGPKDPLKAKGTIDVVLAKLNP